MRSQIIHRCIALFFLLLLLHLPLSAQDQWHVSARYQYAIPTAGLNNWFKPSTQTYAVEFGFGDVGEWEYAFRFESLLFATPNKERLYYDDLQVRLEMVSAALEGHYAFIEPISVFRPFLLWEVGIYRWFSERGAYTIDDPATDSEVEVPFRNQSDWSWGFAAGAGVDMALLESLSFVIDVRYRLVIGELWPALSLELENVSVFQMFIPAAGLTFRF
ncbi:MAG: hypothetical protein E4H13_08685 [Calditrichales bacterium]|nr:MAG: hypothetical protein E4H13_08685 [Calditrichales bacterium]